ncbi:GNAT family N-acetyltransferase [Sinomonas sp. P47F7]|uniref:GNAT family N-acetyltransferase n=1 Tax=Sinomonas sp. P47F7 TaxID=3410987 RepID=UPI003BF56106
MFAHQLPSGAELRPLEPWQGAEFADHLDRAREHIRPWVGPTFVTAGVEAATATLTRYATATAADGARIYGIWSGGTLVGGVMFVGFDAPRGVAELGCWLEPGAEGRGLVSEACRALVRWAFEIRGLHRIEWRCRATNARSGAVAQRLGMTLEGTLRQSWPMGDAFDDTQIWALLSAEWQPELA